MSARRALGIQEILCMVLKHFHPERWLDTDELRSGKVSLQELRRTLARLARVSRAFSGPALCALWAVIDDFEPLLRLLSCCQVVQVESEDGESNDEESKPAPEDEDELRNTLQVLSGEISPSDWERFQYYAGLVRVCLYDYVATIDPSVYLQLSLHNGDKPLLPNLRYLKWEQQSCNTYELLHIIGPSLRRLEFDFASETWRSGHARRREYALKALLDNATRRAPRVEDLHIRGVHYPDTLSAVHAWTHLRHVSVDLLVEVAALQIMAGLKNLTSLRMDISDIRGRGETCDGFKSLESLHIEGIPPALEWFFGATQLPRLTSLTVFISATLTRDTCRRRLEALQIHVKYPRLRSLRLRIAYEGEDVPSVTEIIRPLFAMKELEAFDLNFTAIAHLSDADVEEITRHWSKLRSLKIDHVFTTIEPSVRTLDIIARGLPHLEELVLPSVCHESYIPDKPCAPPHHNLRRIIFFRAMISDRGRFTKYMLQTFPNVVPSLPTLFYRRPCEDWCLIVDSFRPVH